MEVKLMEYTPCPEEVCIMAARTCYSPMSPIDLYGKPLGKIKILEDVIKSGHHSVLEHASFTFAIVGVSRVLTHQLVRHRMASFEQRSDRYVEAKDFSVVCPEAIEKNVEANMIFADAVAKSIETYNELVRKGIDYEDARYVLPQGMTTQLVVTMNARELRHFFSLRCCNRAQKEIRDMADAMLKECKKVAPVLFEGCGPACINKGCPEGKRTCGKPRFELRSCGKTTVELI